MAVKISELPALDILAVGDLVPVVDISSNVTKKATGQQVLDLVQATSFVDDVFRILGSGDATKKLAFEVDGITTGTTRTVTAPDRNLSLTDITLHTPQASTSGTVIDFGSIPAGIKRVTVMLNEVSTSGTSAFRVQLGDAGGFEVTGYAGSVDSSGAAVNIWNGGAGIDLSTAAVAAGVFSGVLTLTLLNSSTNVWAAMGILTRTDAGAVYRTAGRKALSAVLTQVRITTVTPDTFDAGEINIVYE